MSNTFVVTLGVFALSIATAVAQRSQQSEPEKARVEALLIRSERALDDAIIRTIARPSYR
jgi:hypothetical protein